MVPAPHPPRRAAAKQPLLHQLQQHCATLEGGGAIDEWGMRRGEGGQINEWGMRKGILYTPYKREDIRRRIVEAGFEIDSEAVSGNCYNVLARKPAGPPIRAELTPDKTR